MKKLIYSVTIITVLAMVSPAVASAAWWNPFSWFRKAAPSTIVHTNSGTTGSSTGSQNQNSAGGTIKEIVVPDSAMTSGQADMHVQGILSTMRAQAELYKMGAGSGSYAGLCADSETTKLFGANNIACNATASAWAASAMVTAKAYFCVDASGRAALVGNGLSPNQTACPTTPADSTIGTTKETMITTKLGQIITVLGVHATITDVIEDSRCPAGVQCASAGTMRVKVHATYGLLSKNIELALGQPFEFHGHSATLESVTPGPVQGKTTAPGEYVFTISLQ